MGAQMLDWKAILLNATAMGPKEIYTKVRGV